jgi:hypothetical protein
MRLGGKILLGTVAVVALLQVGRCERTNPPVSGDIETPADVKEVLRRACYDCHSNETRWPWYAHVAPASWLLHRDVVEGRRHMNFSEWDKLAADKRQKRRGACWREVEAGDMPPWFYRPLHRAARLTPEDKAILQKWSTGG